MSGPHITPGDFIVTWKDAGVEPSCPANPRYPDGVDLDATAGAVGCRATLPYPAPRVGAYELECRRCGRKVAVTTAGRADDPRSFAIACNLTRRRLNG